MNFYLIRDYYFKDIFLIWLYLILYAGDLYSQQSTHDEVIAAYIFNFSQNIEWPNEQNINEFHFNIITDNKNLVTELNRISLRKKIRNKLVMITSEENLTTIDSFHLIFVAKNKEALMPRIFDEVVDKNILLISKNYLNKKIVMINLYETQNQTINFEINKANILNQGLTILPEMILLGGTEIDVAKLYRESQDTLRIKEEQVTALEQLLDSLNMQIENSYKEIDNYQLIIGKQKYDILQQQNQMKNLQEEFQRLLANVKAQNDTLSKQVELLQISQKLFQQQQNEIDQRKAILLSQKSKIDSQKAAILLHKKILNEQGSTIKFQKNILYLLALLVLLTFGLSYAIFKGYKNKQLSNQQLQKQKEKLQKTLEELEIVKNKTQQYLDIAGVILVAIDANQKVTMINQKGCEVLGYNLEEIIGKDWFETFIPPNVRGDVIKCYHQLMSQKVEQSAYFENPVLTYCGEERLIAWYNVLLKDNYGNIVSTLSSGEDITERKHAEEQIKNLNYDLQNRAVALEKANNELEAFAYSVSHDLRAPLRHIDGFLELLQNQIAADLDKKGQHYMETIADATKRMGILIDDLLRFSRMGRQEMLKKPLDMNLQVKEIIHELEPDTHNRIIKWHIGKLPVVTGDQTMLRMVLTNLISNALKFTYQRQKTEIEIGCNQEKDTETIIFVRDNGVGFDQKYADKLFGVFQRLHRVEEFDGTGVGLASVKRIINRHGGKTWAEGKLNQGATFYFSLPSFKQGVN